MKRKLNILFYQPYNQAVNYIESLLGEMISRGHKGYFLSHERYGDTHFNIEQLGGETFSQPVEIHIPGIYHLQRLWQLAYFCRKHNIDIVYSHYQEANLIAVATQYFTKAKFIITRHHSDCGHVDQNYREVIGDKVINKLAKVYIAPSNKVYDQIVNIEGACSKKVKRIDYGYNFGKFNLPNKNVVQQIRKQYPAKLLLVKAARLIPEKRHLVLFKVLKDLVVEGIDVKVLVLGKGPNLEMLEHYVQENHIEKNVFFLGFKSNIQDYYVAADMVVHLSISEASNSAIKEAGLLGKAVAVCKDVGDFSDYIDPDRNGFLLSKDCPETELKNLLIKVYYKEFDTGKIGQRLKRTIVDRFSIEKVFAQYESIHQDIFF